MTAFIVVCAAMVAAALLWLLVPLIRARKVDGEGASSTERWLTVAAIGLAVPVVAAALYSALSSWDWRAVAEANEKSMQMDEALQTLETKLAQNPDNLQGWLMLGRSYLALERHARAVDAYQQAYNLSKGQNVEAVLGLGEALVLTDNASLTGRAGRLFDAALTLDPNNPKALWYGSLASLQQGDLVQGRDRLKRLMAQNPPEQLRGILQRQIQDLDEQIAGSGQGSAPQPPAGSEGAATAATRVIRVSVTLAPALQGELNQTMPLFVLARDPSAGGPPLAVQRHQSSELPLTLELSERDAMIPTRTIASVPRVQVVARLSRSGSPQAQSGDLYGDAEVEFGKHSGTLNIIIDRKVP